ncbi:metallophosphoesterase [Paenibacillus validus]|uniref:Metallophosphoesterase n=1 Tax=Paenibacillus validus TaxID=44253 RepID=A0A7X2ZGL9_9BACL|nr:MULTISPECIES: metallophosphoesterase [Paenibacillus]MED4603591.1 metallophosphoesterase [Paenibacillus validus]MED4607985.1 metallophosphoesterase [Paenibacillus validus]MUG73816.1 metallophosphoesterase [Paenibacillus validus]
MIPNPSPRKRKLTRRSFLKKAALTVLGTMAIPPTALAYARYAEPKWLDIVRLKLEAPRLPQALNGLTVVQFSDTHLGFHYNAEDLERLAETINRLNPDLVCFTGDLIDYAIGADGPAYAEALGRMQAKLGKFAVLGNHDYFSGPANVARTLEAGGFRTLRNAASRVQSESGMFWVAGVEDMWHGKPDIGKALEKVPKDAFTLLLSHSPDFADTAVQHPVDLQLSGHSHGGQVRLPFYGHVVTPKFGKKYVIGEYALGANHFRLYVNRGIGVSQHPIRFLCRPELTFITLQRG